MNLWHGDGTVGVVPFGVVPFGVGLGLGGQASCLKRINWLMAVSLSFVAGTMWMVFPKLTTSFQARMQVNCAINKHPP